MDEACPEESPPFSFSKPIREYTAIEEVVLIFLDAMLPDIIESWTTIEVDSSIDTSSPTKAEEVSEVDQKGLSQISVTGRKRKSSRDVKSKRSTSVDSQKSKLARSTSKIAQTSKKELTKSFPSSIENSITPTEWRLKKPDEVAIVKLKNGTVYEGRISRLMMDGHGVFNWTDGSSYEGCFVENTATGIGKMIFPDLSWYDGAFLEGYRHGYGSFSVGCTTMSYCGDWFVGTKHGNGYMIYVENNYYNGNWENNKRHGFGHRLYGNGCYYCGQFENGKRHGTGTIYWPNNNLYRGEWKNGSMHGYGEYIWNGFFNKSFSCPIENTYHGHWRDGKRNGRGILNFGVISGARFEGYFKNDLKHGPGSLLCGNGSIVIANPMFLYDNPIHGTTFSVFPQPLKPTEMIEYIPESKKMEISLQCDRYLKPHKHKEAVAEDTNQYVPYKKEIDYYQAPPIHLPVHAPCHMLDLTYIIRKICDKYEMCTQRSDNTLLVLGKKFRNSSMKTYEISTMNLILEKSTESVAVETEECKDGKDTKKTKRDKCLSETTVFTDPNQELYEETWIRHCILMHMPRLWEIYHQYANICVDNEHKQQRCYMIRMFLWQLYRDCQITMKLSLVDIDALLADNPQSFVESISNPFEKIYFWQFLQSLLLIAWSLYNEDATESDNIRGILAGAFTKFLFNDLYPFVGKFQGGVLFQYRDIAPIEAMYAFFKTFGDPITARTFLLHACTRANELPKHYEVIPALKRHAHNVYMGTNTVAICDSLVYLPGETIFGADTTSDSDFQDTNQIDEFYYNLFCLRNIGVIEMIECIRVVCPSTVSKKLVLNLNYKLTFLEFYEIIIRCLERDIELTKIRIRREEEMRRRLQAMQHNSNLKVHKSIQKARPSRHQLSLSAPLSKHDKQSLKSVKMSKTKI